MIYIVTSGCYSDYGIDAVFQNRDKAEAYCQCHPDTEIEEWEFFDGNTYTPFNVVKISMHIRLNGTNDIYFKFKTLSKEDNEFYMSNLDFVSAYSQQIEIHLRRLLPQNYDKEMVEKKYTKAFYDLVPEIKYILSELELRGKDVLTNWEEYECAKKCVKEYIAGKFGIETESI